MNLVSQAHQFLDEIERIPLRPSTGGQRVEDKSNFYEATSPMSSSQR